MTEEDIKECAEEIDHCWHQLAEVLTTHPPIYTDRCCFCGNDRRRQNFPKDMKDHGPFAPDIHEHLGL